MICVHIYIYLKTAKIEAFPFVKDPFAVPEKWQFHLATGVCAFRQLFSFMPKKMRSVLGGGMRKLPPSRPCRAGRITYVLKVRCLPNSLWLLCVCQQSLVAQWRWCVLGGCSGVVEDLVGLLCSSVF